MSTLDGQELFSSGPHLIKPGPWHRAMDRRSFPGTDGEAILDMGLRSRVIEQTGRLFATSVAGLHTLISNVESKADGTTHTLVDNCSQTYTPVILEKFELTTPPRRGRGFWADYKITYRQLP